MNLSEFADYGGRHLPGIVGHAQSLCFDVYEYKALTVTVSADHWATFAKNHDVLEHVTVEVDEDCFQVYACAVTGKTMFSGKVVVAIVEE